MKTAMFVIAHKPAELITKNPIYRLLQVGADNNPHFTDLADDTGDNISEKNKNYCELTGQYWIWKNYTDADIVGICHYRRYFFRFQQFLKILITGRNQEPVDSDYIESVLTDHDMIVRYYPRGRFKSVYRFYGKYHNIKDLDATRSVIEDIYPDYVDAFDNAMHDYRLHSCNMIICRKAIFDAYSEWLFSILFELARRIDISAYDDFQQRVFGFISERLLRVWIVKNDIRIKECFAHYVNDERNLIRRSISLICNPLNLEREIQN